MATRKTTAPQQEPAPAQPVPPTIKKENLDCGLPGMLQLLRRYTCGRTERGGFMNYSKLTDSELVALANQANNLRKAATEGLRLMSDMAHGHDSAVNELDMNSFTWLMSHLVDTIDEMTNIDGDTALALSDRGYDFMGRPMAQAVQS